MAGRYLPVTLAAIEGKFKGGRDAGVAIIGQPNAVTHRLDNPIEVPSAFLPTAHFKASFMGSMNIRRKIGRIMWSCCTTHSTS